MEVTCLKTKKSQFSHLISSACQCGHAADQWNATPNSLVRLVTKNPFLVRGKGHFAKRGTLIKQNLKFIGKSRRKSGQSRLRRKKRQLRILWLRHSRDFSLLDRLMKTLISERFAKWGGNYLWFHCCAVQKRDVNKICKSRSRTKARGKHKHSDGGLFRPSEDPLNHSFSRISRSC